MRGNLGLPPKGRAAHGRERRSAEKVTALKSSISPPENGPPSATRQHLDEKSGPAWMAILFERNENQQQLRFLCCCCCCLMFARLAFRRFRLANVGFRRNNSKKKVRIRSAESSTTARNQLATVSKRLLMEVLPRPRFFQLRNVCHAFRLEQMVLTELGSTSTSS